MLTRYCKTGLAQAFLLTLALHFSGCNSEKETGIYYPMKNRTWDRFNVLDFSLPVQVTDKYHDLVLYIWFTDFYGTENLPVNVIINNPSGEERILEVLFKVRDAKDTIIIPCKADTCYDEFLIQRGLKVLEEGNLSVQIENLNPKITTPGIAGVGIKLVPSP